MDTKYGNPTVQDVFLATLDEAGITYEFTPAYVTLDEMFLDDYKILVIWDPEGTYSEAEKLAIHDYVENGGILLFLGTSYFDTVDIVFDDLNDLLSVYGIQLVKERMIDLTDYYGCHCGTTPKITNFADDSFFYNIDEIALRHTMRLEITSPAYAIAWGDDDAFIDLNLNEILDEGEMVGNIPVIAENDLESGGKVIVFATENIFSITSITLSDNEKFAINLFSDLISDYNSRPVDDGSPTMYYIVGGILIAAFVLIALVLVRRHGKDSTE
ncbi:MAG TPA: hypothetical protein PK718_07415 [Candidatus Methanofastidiosa archaeon]|nr:hypothetical protein [Candidatus Methanofastidiosa archaeon]